MVSIQDIRKPSRLGRQELTNLQRAVFPCGIFLATIADAQGNWRTLATNGFTFSTSGQSTYIGSANYLADTSKPVSYHAPGDFNLSAEGGMIKTAVWSTFAPGTITVNALET